MKKGSLIYAGAVLGALCVAAPSASAFSAGDPARGRELVVERCAGCHEVPDYYRGARLGPSFMELATDDTTYDAETIKSALKKPHWPGGKQISRGEIGDVLAFIATLRME